MVNGRPETYREITVLKKANKIAEYVFLEREDMEQKICDFLLETPLNKVVATPNNLMFVDGAGRTVDMQHVSPNGKTFDLIEMTSERLYIRTPYSSSSDSGGSSSNNNNNNNNNNNS